MVRGKKPVHRVQITCGKCNIIWQLIEEYYIESTLDIQQAIKDFLGGTIKEMMDAHIIGAGIALKNIWNDKNLPYV